MPVRKVSKVDERLKAAEGRRAEMQRQRELEVQAAAERKRSKTNTESSAPSPFTNPTLRQSSTSLSRSQVQEQVKKAKVQEEQEQTEAAPCQCQLQQHPLCFTKHGEFIPGRFMKCQNELIPIRQHRPWLTFKRQPHKLFTIKHLEELLQKGNDLDLVAVMLDVLRRSCSSRHPIQNKFLQLQSKLMALERSRAQLEMRRRSDSISPLNSPKFSCNMNDLRSPGSSMETLGLYRDDDGLLSNAAIDEITSRHNLSPIKNRYALKPSLASHAHLLKKTPIKQASGSAPEKLGSSSTSGHNFKTILSPRKHQMRDVDAQTVLTPLRKSARNSIASEEAEFNEEAISELLLQDETVAFVSNPYIKSSPTKRNARSNGSGQGN